MDARVLVLRDATGAAVKTLDVSDIGNTSSSAPMALTVETRCDLGEWHQAQRTEFVPWGDALVNQANDSRLFPLVRLASGGNLPLKLSPAMV